MLMTRRKSLEANFAISAGLLIFYYFWRYESLLIAAIIFAILGLLIPSLAKYIAKAWFKLAELLGRINGVILLSILFFALLTPLAFIRRLLGGAVLKMKKEDNSKSYFVKREHEFDAKDLVHPW
jgi:polyferredoxin